jgi:flagellar biosynthesis GTPase FlhF
MKKLLLVVMVGVALVALTACSTKASKEDCMAACKKISDLQKAIPTAAAKEDTTAKATDELDKKLKELQDQQAKTSEDLDKELTTKQAGLKKQADKIKLIEEFKVKKEDAAKAVAKMVQEVMEQKAQILKNIEDAKAKAELEAVKLAQETVNTCIDVCQKSGFSKKLTDCQKTATKFEDIGKCGSSAK